MAIRTLEEVQKDNSVLKEEIKKLKKQFRKIGRKSTGQLSDAHKLKIVFEKVMMICVDSEVRPKDVDCQWFLDRVNELSEKEGKIIGDQPNNYEKYPKRSKFVGSRGDIPDNRVVLY